MKRTAAFIALAIAALIALWVLLRPGESPTSPTDRDPVPPPDPAPSRLPDPPEPLEGNRDRSALSAFLDRLGRALVTGDERTVLALRATPPKIYRSDIDWLLRQIDEPLFTAAGAAEVCLWYKDLRKAIPLIEARLWSSDSVFLKDQFVRVLSRFGGDGIPVLITALTRLPEASVRVRVVLGLAPHDSPTVRQALIDTLRSDPSPHVRNACAEVLGGWRDDAVLAALLEAIDREQDARARTGIILEAYRSGDAEVRRGIEEAVRSDPEVSDLIRAQARLRDDSRYRVVYPDGFFAPGQVPVSWDPTSMDRLGITLNLEAAGGMTMEEAARRIFSQSPFDRYSSFFYLRDATAMEEDLQTGASSPRAWDSSGTPVPGGLPPGEHESTMYLRFRDPSEFGQNILGYTEGSEANVTTVSLLHELGHAFARLADEYDAPAASDAGGANVDRGKSSTPKWQALIDQGHLDAGRFGLPERRIPGLNCHMNNHPDDSRYCPVCQLEIIAKLCERTGALPPW